jgi:PKD repeat protein
MKRLVLSLVVLLVGCGSGGNSPSGATGGSNQAPTGSFRMSPEGVALMGGTMVTFTATANDADGDAIQYAWNFGDGQTGSGATTTHAFQSAGSLTVTCTISDSKGASTSMTGTAAVKGLSGQWVDADPDYSLELTQTGSTFTGKVFSTWNGQVSDITGGVVRDPRSLSFHRESFKLGYATCDYTGTVDATGDHIHAVCVQNDRTSFDLTRR